MSALVFITLSLIAVIGVIGVVEKVSTGSFGVSVATIGDPEACASVEANAVSAIIRTPRRELEQGDVASLRGERFTVCLADPTVLQKAASALKPVGDLVLGLGALLLVQRAIRTARRTKLFGLPFARQVQQLGWYLLFSSLVWPFVSAAGRGVVLEAAVPRQSWSFTLFDPGISIGLVVASLGVLTVARVLRQAILLQEEVEETV